MLFQATVAIIIIIILVNYFNSIHKIKGVSSGETIAQDLKEYTDNPNLTLNLLLENLRNKQKNLYPVKQKSVILSPELKTDSFVGRYQSLSSCSKKSWKAGMHQKVIAYSIFGKNDGYWKGMKEIISTVRKLYPGWFVRIYTDNPNRSYVKELEEMFDNLHICDVYNSSGPKATLTIIVPGVIWRFSPLKDPEVDVLLVRDADSQIIQREVDAVTEWLNATSFSLHVMRDHPYHKVSILAGMWGARITSGNRKKWNNLCDQMLKRASRNPWSTKIDQPILMSIVWPAFQEDFIAHDSYTCRKFPGSRPFPTERVDLSFIGNRNYVYTNEKVKKECPMECRPRDHQDWKYC